MKQEDIQKLDELGISFLGQSTKSTPSENLWTVLMAVDLKPVSITLNKVFRVNATFLAVNDDKVLQRQFVV